MYVWKLYIFWPVIKFLSTGKYEPIRKVVNALRLEKYKGTLEKLKSREIKATEKVERDAYLEATYASAVWSLISNCKQMPLVFKYCVFMYDNDELDEGIKSQLGSILRIVQKEIHKEKEASANYL